MEIEQFAGIHHRRCDKGVSLLTALCVEMSHPSLTKTALVTLRFKLTRVRRTGPYSFDGY